MTSARTTGRASATSPGSSGSAWPAPSPSSSACGGSGVAVPTCSDGRRTDQTARSAVTLPRSEPSGRAQPVRSVDHRRRVSTGSRPANAASRSYGGRLVGHGHGRGKDRATVLVGQSLLHEGEPSLGDLVVQGAGAAERARQVPRVHGDLRDLEAGAPAASAGWACQWWIRSSAPARNVVAQAPSAICGEADQSTSSPRDICRKRAGPAARCVARSRTDQSPHGVGLSRSSACTAARTSPAWSRARDRVTIGDEVIP